MRNILIVTVASIAFILGYHPGKTQSLAFSRVINVGAAEDTVPAGKVWKVESAMASNDLQIQTNTTSHQSKSVVISVNGASVYVKSTWGSSYGNGMLETTSLPIWLPAGQRLRASTYCAGISVIEFTIVP